MKKVLASVIAAAWLLSACAISPSSAVAPIGPTSLPDGSARELQLGTLAPRKLASGECGMFLWAKTSERNLVFFNARGGSGHMVLGGREIEVVRGSAEGQEILGQYETQIFRHQDISIEIQIQFERRPGLARGAIIPQGALRLKRDDGWESIIPVGGLVGCGET